MGKAKGKLIKCGEVKHTLWVGNCLGSYGSKEQNKCLLSDQERGVHSEQRPWNVEEIQPRQMARASLREAGVQQGWIMQGPEGQTKVLRLNSGCCEEPLQGFKQGSDRIWLKLVETILTWPILENWLLLVSIHHISLSFVWVELLILYRS